MSINYEQLGERIRKMRKEKNITQETLGEQIGLTSAQIYNIETARSRPSIESLINISDVFQVSVDELLFGHIRYFNDSCSNELSELITDCNDNEKHIIIESVRSLKNLLKEYANTDN